MSDPLSTGESPNAGSVNATAPTVEKSVDPDGFTPGQIKQLNAMLSNYGKRGPDVDTLADRLVSKLTAVPKPEPTEMELLQMNLRKVSEELATEKNARKAEKKSLNEKSALAEVTSHLSGKVDSGAMSIAINLLKPSLLVSEEGAAFQMNGQTVPVADGVALWLQSKEAEYFRPVPNSNHSSTSPNQLTRAPQFPVGGKQPSSQDSKDAAALAFLRQLKG